MTSSRLLLASLAAWTTLAGTAHAYYDGYAATYQYQYAPTYDPFFKCDDCVKTVNLPFSFPYYGKQFSQITISSNGYVVLGS